jgi:hypothetical protein
MQFKPLVIGVLAASALLGQELNPTQGPQATQNSGESRPLYHVDVVAHTTKAVSYGHRSAPTKIDFAGTVLQPDAKGEASINKDRSVVQIDAKFKKLAPPHRFGPEYLTYVMWALTPDGRATNLGELVTNADDDAKIETSTELQVFALIVTAEPYYAVTQPSDVVLLENVVRPDTIGRVQTVDVKYELLKRGSYTFDLTAAETRENHSARKVSQREYESIVELYQARNAVQLAKAEGADVHAAESFARAENQLKEAEQIYAADPKGRAVVTLAREATQTAEDARLISARRQAEAASGGIATNE